MKNILIFLLFVIVPLFSLSQVKVVVKVKVEIKVVQENDQELADEYKTRPYSGDPEDTTYYKLMKEREDFDGTGIEYKDREGIDFGKILIEEKKKNAKSK